MDVRSTPAPVNVVSPILKAGPNTGWKLFFAFALSAAGMYYLSSGKKQQSFQRMILGALLVLGALFVL